MNTILVDQNKPELIKLLKAQRVAYTEAKRIQNIEWWVQIISLISPLVGILVLPRIYEQGFIYLTTVLLIFYAITYILGKNKTKEGANIQEQFDTKIFNLPWDSFLVGDKVDTHRIIELSRNYKKDDLKDWYSKEIKPDIEERVAILICQNINLTWDSSLRKRFINYFTIFTITYCFIFLIIIFCKNLGFQESTNLFLPVFPYLLFAVINISNQNEILLKKKIVKDKIRDCLEKYKQYSQQPSIEELRSIQNLIYNERSKPEKIPNWFYRRYKENMESTLDECVISLIQEYDLL